MPRPVPRHDRDAGGPAELLAAKAALRDEVWSAAARGGRGPVPRRSRAHPELHRRRGRGAAATRDARVAGRRHPQGQSGFRAELPVRQRALEDGKTVYMAVPKLAGAEPFFALDPDHLAEPPRRAASISGATRSARRVTLADLPPVDLVVIGSVAVGADGTRLGQGGGFADLEFALAATAGLIGPRTVTVTTVHELQIRPAASIPRTEHDVPVDVIVTPDRVIDCRRGREQRPSTGHLLG